MDAHEPFDEWWQAQRDQGAIPNVQKGTMRRGWRLGAAAERDAILAQVRQRIDDARKLPDDQVLDVQSLICELDSIYRAIEARGKGE